RLVTRAAIAEVMTVEYARLFEQADGAIDGGDRNAAVDLGRAFIERLDVGMILRIRNDARDDPALLGDAQALFVAQRFKIDGTGHAGLSCKTQSSFFLHPLYRVVPGIEQGRPPAAPPRTLPRNRVMGEGFKPFGACARHPAP